MAPSLVRWSRHFAIASIAGLVGALSYAYAPFSDTHPVLSHLGHLGWLNAPGQLASILLGGSVHGGDWSDWRDYVIGPLISGAFWGTLTFVVAYALRARRQRDQVNAA